MNVEFRSSFARDLKKISNRALLQRVRRAIEQVEQAGSLGELSQVQKLKGNKYDYPHKEVLGRAAETSAAVLQTDEPGTNDVGTDGEQICWETNSR